jgi:hypothetical protein
MQLPPEQTERFYRIWVALLLPLSDEMRLRNALWIDDSEMSKRDTD